MGVERGLWVEVKVPGDERTSTPAVFKDLGRCLTLPAAALRRLIVVIGVIYASVWRAMSVARTPDALVLDVESCNQLAGCPGCGLNRPRPRSYGGEGNRRAHGFMTSSPDGSRVAAPTPTTPAAWATVALEAKYFSSTLPRIYNMSHLLLSPGFTIAS